MADHTSEKKWNDIYTTQFQIESKLETKAASVLLDYAYLLPSSGLALDLACGLGGNAIYLAQCGLNTHAWDISAIAIERVQAHCQETNISIAADVRDIEQHPPTSNSFDVICVSYYLERTLTQDIIAALRPKGLLFYQTYTNEKVSTVGPSNPQYRLQQNELLALFSPLHVLAYQEHGTVGNVKKGLRDVASLVAQKR
ncbi:MAG: methyltransferase domain-containing protein [Gammaproteobacteria bacterium]|nr:MAG: methyltransferase domain-containing protein [Gammaproteobacteria bacterium]